MLTNTKQTERKEISHGFEEHAKEHSCKHLSSRCSAEMQKYSLKIQSKEVNKILPVERRMNIRRFDVPHDKDPASQKHKEAQVSDITEKHKRQA